MLASLHERRHDYAAALQVSDAYIQLAASGKMPRSAQRSADRKLPHFEARVERYRHLLARDQAWHPDTYPTRENRIELLL